MSIRKHVFPFFPLPHTHTNTHARKPHCHHSILRALERCIGVADPRKTPAAGKDWFPFSPRSERGEITIQRAKMITLNRTEIKRKQPRARQPFRSGSHHAAPHSDGATFRPFRVPRFPFYLAGGAPGVAVIMLYNGFRSIREKFPYQTLVQFIMLLLGGGNGCRHCFVPRPLFRLLV